MKYLDQNFSEPMENLACDEFLIECCEREQGDGILRVWEPRQYFVVAGYSNQIAVEVDRGACVADGVPVLRRRTGGGAVLQGPGCLNYTLVFAHEEAEWSGDVARTYRFVLERHRNLFSQLTGAPVSMAGTSDLTIGGRKFSGNAQYRKRRGVLIHGTVLLHFDLARMGRYLPMPSKEPGYRQRRSHGEFLVNLEIDPATAKCGLRDTWNAMEECDAPPQPAIAELVRKRYSRPEWKLKF